MPAGEWPAIAPRPRAYIAARSPYGLTTS